MRQALRNPTHPPTHPPEADPECLQTVPPRWLHPACRGTCPQRPLRHRGQQDGKRPAGRAQAQPLRDPPQDCAAAAVADAAAGESPGGQRAPKTVCVAACWPTWAAAHQLALRPAPPAAPLQGWSRQQQQRQQPTQSQPAVPQEQQGQRQQQYLWRWQVRLAPEALAALAARGAPARAAGEAACACGPREARLPLLPRTWGHVLHHHRLLLPPPLLVTAAGTTPFPPVHCPALAAAWCCFQAPRAGRTRIG